MLPSWTFHETRIPLTEESGKVEYNIQADDLKSSVRVIVPSGSRPGKASFEEFRKNSVVLRFTLDSRFTDSKTWTKIKFSGDVRPALDHWGCP